MSELAKHVLLAEILEAIEKGGGVIDIKDPVRKGIVHETLLLLQEDHPEMFEGESGLKKLLEATTPPASGGAA